MSDFAKRISDIFVGCLFRDGEPTDTAVIVDGTTATFGFHPERLAAAKVDIAAIASEIVADDFRKSIGGGASFLNLCMTRTGEHWGGHLSCQELTCLAVASGVAAYCAPRAMWPMLPGAMPYVVFDV